jgi:hypothetical protein
MVTSSHALLHTLMVCIRSYLKLVLRYKFVILDTYHPETVREQGCEDPWLFFEDNRGSVSKSFGNTDVQARNR